VRRSGFRESTNRSAALVVVAVLAAASAFSSPASDDADPGAERDTDAIGRVLLGAWGGEHIRLDVGADGATLEFDCAFGRIDKPLIADSSGNFQAHGVVMFEAGGPVRPGQPPPPAQAAIYQGWTDGRELRLTITILGETDWQLGTFTLGFGRRAVLEKCL
jgi:hypothetical protein